MNKKKLPLMDTVISAVNRTYPKADEKEIEFVFDYEKELETCTIMQDKRWLGEAVINVLDNAIKYSPGGSKIFIRIQKRNDLVSMEIEDQGIGIPQNEDVYKRQVIIPVNRLDYADFCKGLKGIVSRL